MRKKREGIISIQNLERKEKQQRKDNDLCTQKCLRKSLRFLFENEYIRSKIH